MQSTEKSPTGNKPFQVSAIDAKNLKQPRARQFNKQPESFNFNDILAMVIKKQTRTRAFLPLLALDCTMASMAMVIKK